MEAPYQGTRSHDPPAASAMKLGPTYLTTRALSGLAHYAYKPSGYTVLDRLHQPFWNCEFWAATAVAAPPTCLLAL